MAMIIRERIALTKLEDNVHNAKGPHYFWLYEDEN